MLLPPELLTIISLAGLAAARAQVDNASASTKLSGASGLPSVDMTPASTPPPAPSEGANDLAPTHVDSTKEPLSDAQPTDDVYPCDLPDPPEWCNPPDFWHPEVSVTGWDDWGEWDNDGIGGDGVVPTTTVPNPLEQTPIVITTTKPTIIDIQTNVESYSETFHSDEPAPAPTALSTGATPAQQQELSARPTVAQDMPQSRRPGGNSHIQAASARPAPQQSAPVAPTPEIQPTGAGPNTALQETTLSENDLLNAVIDRLVKTEPRAQPLVPMVSTVEGSREHENDEPELRTTDPTRARYHDPDHTGGVMPGRATQDAFRAASSYNSITVGDAITFGSATLTLTPGLITTVGTGTATTLIAIHTDSANYTVVTVSSSGIAVTATITNAPAIVTLPVNDYEPSVTSTADQDSSTSLARATAAATSSKGTANEQRKPQNGLSGLVLGVFGLYLVS